MANKLNIVEMVEVLMTLPHNIKAPNVHIIEQIFELIQHPNIVAHKMLKHNAHIAFATILNRACFNTQESVFPVNVFGEMCTPENPKIANEYIPHPEARAVCRQRRGGARCYPGPWNYRPRRRPP